MELVVLEPEDPALEGMVRLPGFTFNSIEYADFHMDRYEVTNRAFKEFVDAGGYRNPEHWLHPIVTGGEELAFGEAMALFVDQTGRPGPSTWRLGTFPEGQEDYPVGGVSWYEAAAYARWAGKELPTTLQWDRGRLYYRETSHFIGPRSNLGSTGPRPVGLGDAMTTLGVYDMAGNVREWCYNEAGEGERATRGAAWPDAPFHVGWVIPKPPFDRDATHGFRLIKASDEEEALAALRHPVSRTTVRDFRAERPVSDAEFEVFRRLYAYDPYPLRAVVERVDTLERWIREVVAFDVPYGERGGAASYLPRDKEGPFQPILYWGGSGIFMTRSIDEEWTRAFAFMVQAGRAVVVPIFKGAYGRDMPPTGRYGGSYTSSAYRDATIQWMKDLSATVDYLETRADMEADKLGYYGFSHGGYMAPIVMAVESRVRASVTNVGGLHNERFFPEADPFNFLPRAHSPLLMINGRYDIVFPYETQQLPMFELLGTPQEDKRHYLSPAAHGVPMDEVIRETLNWFDKYLGVPGG
jgi:eukaryotic-like serine/threonine-protein kinase